MSEERSIHPESGLIDEMVEVDFGIDDYKHIVKGLKIYEKPVKEDIHGYYEGEIVLNPGDKICTIVVFEDSLGKEGFKPNTVIHVGNEMVKIITDEEN